MRLSDFFGGKGDGEPDKNFQALLTKLDGEYKEARQKWASASHDAPESEGSYPRSVLRDYESGRAILALEADQKSVLVEQLIRSVALSTKATGFYGWNGDTFERSSILSQLIGKVSHLPADRLLRLIDVWAEVPLPWHLSISEHLLGQAAAAQSDPRVIAAIDRWYRRAFPAGYQGDAQQRKLRRHFEAVLTGKPVATMQPTAPWQAEMCSILGEPAYMLAQSASTNEPKKKWLEMASALNLPMTTLQNAVDSACSMLKETKIAILPELSDPLRGLAWLLGTNGSDEACEALYDLAIASNRKIPWVGVVCLKALNACVNTLGSLGSVNALSRLARIRPKLHTFRDQTKALEVMTASAKKGGVSVEELEELIVPVFDLPKRVEAGKGTVTLSIEGSSVSLLYASAEGKPVKTLPKEPAVDDLKKEAKVVKDALVTQRDRIDRLMRVGRQLPYAQWRERYLDNPVVASIARRLIWKLGADSAVPTGQGLVQRNGLPLAEPGPGTIVTLWHPLLAPLDEGEDWRRWIESNGLTQPFKQAHRETYVATEGERLDGATERFSGHLVRQHALAAVAKSRGWRYNLQSTHFDGANDPTLDLGDGLSAELGLEPVSEDLAGEGASGISLYATTGSLRFLRKEAVRLGDVDPLLFSEVLREVDLLVSVSSASHDPAFASREMPVDQADLQGSARTRARVLPGLLRRLGMSEFSLEGRFLHVRGRVASYAIHVGTGNVYVQPSNRLLALSVEPGADVALPFEGDSTLARIVAIVPILIRDDSVRDTEIRKQIESAAR